MLSPSEANADVDKHERDGGDQGNRVDEKECEVGTGEIGSHEHDCPGPRLSRQRKEARSVIPWLTQGDKKRTYV